MIRILAIGLLIAAVMYWFYQRRGRRTERLPAFDRDEIRSTLDARVKLWRELPAHLQDTLLERLPGSSAACPSPVPEGSSSATNTV